MPNHSELQISVVIPSYNHERYVENAIRSVLDQSFGDLELIIVDDGSIDDSCSNIRRTLEQYPHRQTALIEQPNAGAHAAIMRGIENASAPVISLLNSDDAYLPGRLQRLLPLVKDRQYALAFSKVKLVDDEGNRLSPDHAWPTWYESALCAAEDNPTIGMALLEHNFSVTSGNFLFTRSLYEALGGFSEHKFLHDWDFLLRSVYYTEPQFVPEEFMCYRIHESNTTESVRSLLDTEAREAIERFVALWRQGPSPNAISPHPDNWTHFYSLFVNTRHTFFDQRPLAEHLPAEGRMGDIIRHSSSSAYESK